MGRQLTWAWSQLAADAPNAAVKKLLTEQEKVEDWYNVQPMRRGLNPLSAVPEYEGWYLDFFEHADYDAFWKDPMMNWSEHYAQTSDIPMYQIGGWYDIFLAGTFENFVGLSKLKASPQRLLVGPWVHHGDTLGWRPEQRRMRRCDSLSWVLATVTRMPPAVRSAKSLALRPSVPMVPPQ